MSKTISDKVPISLNGHTDVESVPPKKDGLHETVPQKYLVVTGGTISGVGKGTTMSSLGIILKAMGFNVTAIKIDPYLNVDAGTMSPYEHGEVYVLEDGGEVDLDLGNYERFLNVTLTQDHNITTGKINQKVLRDERAGRYLGHTVQLIPHVTDTIQEWIQRVSKIVVDPSRHEVPQICLIEVGGTVGDIESLTYLEALQQFSMRVGQSNFCLCHVSYIPEIGSGLNREQKTKPTQHSIKELMRLGLRPDFIFCRSQNALSFKAKEKISLFGQVPLENIINVHNVSNIYLAPTMIDQQHFGLSVCKKFNITPSQVYLDETKQTFVKSSTSCLTGKQFPHYSLSKFESIGTTVQLVNRFVTIGIVGKYTGFEDAYLSVIRALHHACIHYNVGLKILWIDSSDLESKTCEKAWSDMKTSNGILCPGGFGDRGIEGKMVSANFCRHNNVPYLGICLGMQTAIIDFCRDELELHQADSEEFNKDALDKVIVFMPEINTHIKGGTMRLGNRATIFRDPSSLACRIYHNNPVIYERHRHRYEVNTHYVSAMESKGLCFVGQDDRGQRMEVAELKNHPFFLLVQFHPEFTSRLIRPNPCFLGFIEASLKNTKN